MVSPKTNGAAPVVIMVTGAGAPGIRGTLYALRQNGEGRSVRIIGVDTQNDAVGRFLVDRFYQVPSPEHSGYLDELRKICRQESVAIIVPQTTREVEVLSRCKSALEPDVRVMVSDERAIATANNKSALVAKFKQLGLPATKFQNVKSEAELVKAVSDLGYPGRPVVVKPPISNGMRGVRVLRDGAWDVERFLQEKPSGLEITLDELVAILRRGTRWPELLVMEYLPGPEYTVDAFIGDRFAVALPRLRKKIRSGITFCSESESREDLSEYTLQAAREIGLRYAFGFQFKLDSDGVPNVLESNPRVQGTMVASVFSGANVIWFGVKELLGEPITHLPGPIVPAQFHRFWGGLGVNGESASEI